MRRAIADKKDSIIQDCEDALTSWVEQNAVVKSNLSTRSRTLSQRRHSRARRSNGEGLDLSGQDQPLEGRESGLWVPASEHAAQEYEEEEDEEDAPSTITSEQRGREEQRVAV